MNIRKSATALARDALQVLRTHPSVLHPIRLALDEVKSIPHWKEGGFTAWLARNESIMLKALNFPDDMRPDLISETGRFARRCKAHGVKPPRFIMDETRHFHEAINKRWALKQHIDACAVNGMIGIVESGRDCDCVEYVHPRAAIPATVYHYKKLEWETGKSADGPFSLGIVTPQEAESTEHESRDLVLEAFEDGHPHHIVSRFP